MAESTTTLNQPATVMACGHIVYGFDDNGHLTTAQFLPDEEGMELLPHCMADSCTTLIRRDGSMDVVISYNKKPVNPTTK